MKKENKSVSVTANKMIVTYHDTSKHFVYKLDPPSERTKELRLFGKKLKENQQKTVAKDFLTPQHREIFDDLLYARHRMSKKEIDSLPIVKKYRITVLSKQVEKALSAWKAEIVSKKVDSLLLKLFPNSPVVKELVQVQCEHKDKMYNDSVNVHSIFSEMEIAEYLSSKGLFPKFKV